MENLHKAGYHILGITGLGAWLLAHIGVIATGFGYLGAICSGIYYLLVLVDKLRGYKSNSKRSKHSKHP